MISLLAILVFAQASPADRAIDAAVKAYQGIRTATATFEQSIRNPLLGSTLQSRGEFEQARPNRFVFRFSEPAGDIIVCDGRNVWVYLPTSAPGQVSRAPCVSDQAGSLDLIGEFFLNPRTRYSIGDGGSATLGDRRVQVVLLTPKDRSAAFVRAKVWIDPSDGSLAQFEAEEPNGLVRLVRITSFTPNAAVRPDAFTFKVPKGVRVVDVK
ncbi:MAG TPA: outer membrane lipoprotein carrier protein LolA [Gemmatimonadaceae bacterium]